MKCCVLLWMLVGVSAVAVAQGTAVTFQIKGVLLDSLTHEGEPYATIRVAKKEKPQQAVNGEKEKRMVCVLMCVNPVEEKL